MTIEASLKRIATSLEEIAAALAHPPVAVSGGPVTKPAPVAGPPGVAAPPPQPAQPPGVQPAPEPAQAATAPAPTLTLAHVQSAARDLSQRLGGKAKRIVQTMNGAPFSVAKLSDMPESQYPAFMAELQKLADELIPKAPQ